jgi:hypothetical protein
MACPSACKLRGKVPLVRVWSATRQTLSMRTSGRVVVRGCLGRLLTDGSFLESFTVGSVAACSCRMASGLAPTDATVPRELQLHEALLSGFNGSLRLSCSPAAPLVERTGACGYQEGQHA